MAEMKIPKVKRDAPRGLFTSYFIQLFLTAGLRIQRVTGTVEGGRLARMQQVGANDLPACKSTRNGE